jgi:hypothetical protein
MRTHLRRPPSPLRQAVLRSISILFVVVAAVAAPSLAPAAMLTGTTYDLRLLGHVKNAAGTVFSTEGYQASPVFNVFSTNLTNNVIPSPIPPLAAGKTLRVDESEAGGTAIIWIRGPLSDPSDTFANMLDPNFDVELEFTFRFANLPVDQMITISNVKPENGVHGFYSPVSVQTSGVGSVADPLKMLILLDSADIQGGFGTSHVKLHFDYDTTERPVVPEPATCLLIIAGMLGVAASRRSRRTI